MLLGLSNTTYDLLGIHLSKSIGRLPLLFL